MTTIRPDLLDPEVLEQQGFLPENFEDFAINDDPVARHCGYTITLSIPNGGILGVSFYKKATNECYSLLTEGVEGMPDYYDEDGHTALAKSAIDAAMPEPIAEQLELIKPC